MISQIFTLKNLKSVLKTSNLYNAIEEVHGIVKMVKLTFLEHIQSSTAHVNCYAIASVIHTMIKL
jgi:hypothetical protein